MNSITKESLDVTVREIIFAQPVVDMHTHVYPPSFGTPVTNASGSIDREGLLLWGADELLTYHYLVAEVFRIVPATKLPYEQFWRMTKRQQADHIWKHLFIERTPISEACRGVLTSLTRMGFDPTDRNLNAWRKAEAQKQPSSYIDRVMELANVESITMTNAVFDDKERTRWLKDGDRLNDRRFKAVLRIDPLLRDFPAAASQLASWGYDVSGDLSNKTIEESRRFLRDWIDRMQTIYLAVSLPPEWRYPAPPNDAVAHAGQIMLERVVLPVCAERGVPFAMMIGSRRGVNPALGDAGDMGGLSDVPSVANLCLAFPQNRFFVTMLARENQHELAVAARKFGNLMVFGCWWFLNNPSFVDEITRMRLELLGTSFIPQHSDARVLDQLIYKWEHSRRIIANALTDKYRDLIDTGWNLTRDEISRDARLFLRNNFLNFLAPV